MQLVAYGAQDIYLTGNPQITFFKVVYRRHTNFSMETIVQTLNGTATQNSTTSCTISRNGDLVYRMYVTSEKQTVTNGAETLVSEAELEIGGQKIDKHYSEWMNVWNELSTPESKAVALKAMQGSIGTSNGTSGVGFIQIPLQFWFCRNPGLALPLIALQYHEVKVKVTWGSDADNTCGINCDYIYLDTDERRRFAQVSHEYLIEQLQKEDKSSSQTHKLNFNHPVKELIWTTAAGVDYTKANIKLNGHDRFALQDTEYFQIRQPYECHTAVPAQNLPDDAFAAARAGTTSYDNITSNGGALTFETDPTAALTNVKFSALLFNGSGTAFTDSAVTTGAAVPTKFIGVGGKAAAENGLDVGSLSIGDIHLVQITDVNAATASSTTLAKVVNVYVDDAKHAETTDGTGVFVAPGGGAPAAPTEITNGTTVNADTIVIEYDRTVTKATLADGNDKLSIIKVADAGCRTSRMTKKINVYSFALKPEEHQPSGTCNFSRIDNAQLIFSTAAACTVYAVNYNVLRIMSGMGGLAYSN